MDLHSTIAAISTAPGRAGIGIIRLSGSRALEIVRNIVVFRAEIQARTAYLGKLLDEYGDAVDEVLVTWFPAPHSYSGQEMVEISCHGSPVILDFCLMRCVEAGGRFAEPGEFTLRAYIHGKIDLPQSEAIRDLIESTTLYQAKVAARQKGGSLSRRLNPIKQNLLDLIALLEAGIDFAEDDISVAQTEEILRRLAEIFFAVQAMANSFAWGRIVREGFSIAIVGPPNAGKSSLFNALLRQDRAIVTPIAGTTRDMVSETVDMNGIPVRLLDTAGIRETAEPIEMQGIKKSFEAIADSSVTLVVFDSSLSCEDNSELVNRAQSQGKCLIVANKSDLAQSSIHSEAIRVSAVTGEGIDRLREEVLKLAGGRADMVESGFVTSLRQKVLLDEAAQMVEKARDAATMRVPHEMLLLDLYCALTPLDSISGTTTADDILNRIFSTFCIGK